MSLEDRITRIEAELAIRNVIARYGLAACLLYTSDAADE